MNKYNAQYEDALDRVLFYNPLNNERGSRVVRLKQIRTGLFMQRDINNILHSSYLLIQISSYCRKSELLLVSACKREC